MEEYQDDNAQPTLPVGENVRFAIVHLFLTDQQFFAMNSSLMKPEFFPDEISKKLIIIVKSYHSNYKKIPDREVVKEILLSNFVENSSDYEEMLYDFNRIYDHVVSIAEDKEYLQNIVFDFCKEQAYKNFLKESFNMLTKKEMGNERFSMVDKMYRNAASIGIIDNNGGFYFEQYQERYHKMFNEANESLERFQTGISKVDSDLGGGLSRKETGIVVGLSGTGKSFFLVHLAKHNLLNGKNVLFVTLENAKTVVEKRFDAAFSGESLSSLKTFAGNKVIPKLETLEDLYRKNLHIVEFPMQVTPLEQIRAYARDLKTKYNFVPDLLVIDYLDELRPIDGMPTYDSHAQLSGEIRSWCQEDCMVGFTATQVNRGGASTPLIDSEHLADSFKKINKYDCAWSLNAKPEERAANLMRFYVMKHRNGESKWFAHLNGNLGRVQFYCIDETEYNRRLLETKNSSLSNKFKTV